MAGAKRFSRFALAGAGLAAALTATATAIVVASGGDSHAAARLSVADPYIPLPAGADQMAAGYLTVTNAGRGADRLVRVSSPGASSVTMHRSTESSMESVDGLEVPAEGALTLTRGGTHLMIMGWKQPPAVGDQLELDLTFEKAGTIAVQVPVKPLTYRPGS
ncbi:copper resistance protein CopZ [Streptomyces tateyamensis]|uniref:Copper resistance protein CopZ n=1 Tax=Streptomyces tateyamensis TaxID=565073 RepID=A0A2V4N905_9ACTN|nr:copper chaperone PCu(A)C [Streptomyces tateyamensis]PYC76109.1 copper resistance protein CopZ [Streptomyces tateyamensis]